MNRKITSVIMFLMAAAMVSAWLITVANVPGKVIELMQPFMGNKTMLLIALMVLCMLVGTAMDMTPTILMVQVQQGPPALLRPPLTRGPREPQIPCALASARHTFCTSPQPLCELKV